MTEQFKQELIDLGIDLDTALTRFMGQEMLYEKFIKKFLNDGSYGKLKKAIEDGQTEEAFRSAHTLKGVAGNLGLQNLLNTLEPMVEVLRTGNMDGVQELLSTLDSDYEKLYNIILSNTSDM